MNYYTEKWRMKQDQLDDEAILWNLKDLRVGEDFFGDNCN